MSIKSEGAKKQRPTVSGPLAFLKSRGRVWLLVLGVVLGACLLLIGSGYETSVEEATSGAVPMQDAAELRAYADALEKDLEKLCGAVAHVSGVEAMVTLESGYRTVYALDSDGDPATVGSGNKQQALYATLRPPTVAGVALVCHGGEDPTVRQALVELISTALGISSNRVFVVGK